MDEIFDHWPSVASFARDIGVEAVMARQWKNRRSIPGRYDMRIVAVAKERGFPITIERIARLRAAEAGLLPAEGEGCPTPAR